MAAAIARHAHEPDEKRRNWLIRRTFAQIRSEAESVSVRLPDLDMVDWCALYDEASATVFDELGWDCPDAAADPEIEALFKRLELAARVQAASPTIRTKFYTRRLLERCRPVTDIERRTLIQVAALIAEVSDPGERAMAVRFTEERALMLGVGG